MNIMIAEIKYLPESCYNDSTKFADGISPKKNLSTVLGMARPRVERVFYLYPF
jgi:hypothetical protein